MTVLSEMYQWLLYLLVSTVCSYNVTISPSELLQFRVGDVRNITVTFWSDDLSDGGLDSVPLIKCQDEHVCKVTEVKDVTVHSDNETYAIVYNVTVKTVFLGITYIHVKVDDVEVSVPYIVRVMRAAFYIQLSMIFGGVIAVFITCVTFMMGTQLKWQKIREVLRSPIGPIIGFVCQFLLMPLWGFVLAEFCLPADQMVLKLALFAASTCPGGGKSSFWTIIYGGNLDLSVAMTFTQTIAALFMMPLWLSTLGKRFTTSRVDVPFVAIVEGLLFLLIPSSMGMYFIHRKPHLMKRIEKYIKRCTWFATIFFTGFGVYANWYVFLLFSWRAIAVGCLLPWSGYIIAYVTAYLLRQPVMDRITIAIETGVQNVGKSAQNLISST